MASNASLWLGGLERNDLSCALISDNRFVDAAGSYAALAPASRRAREVLSLQCRRVWVRVGRHRPGA